MQTSMRKRFLTTAAVVAVACGGVALAAGTASAASSDAPLLAPKGQKVDGQYIVVLKDAFSADAVARRHGITRLQTYSKSLKGFAAKLTDAQVTKLRKDASVKYIEFDIVMSINDGPKPKPKTDQAKPGSSKPKPGDDSVSADAVRSNATWGLDRIDQRNLPLDTKYHYTATGLGTTAYVIDTGIYTAHNQFEGRASGGYTAINDGNGTNDCHGHGTHVAGTIAGATYGVSRSAKLVGVRVLDCGGSGTLSGVISGVDWVAYHHKSPSVANMSLGGGYSQALNDAVDSSIDLGVSYVVAAGNSDADACGASPASTPAALTVGATDNTDTRAWWSNYGACVDLFAPGVDITSAWIGNPSATNTISGTSMAAPHVAGVVAVYLQANKYATQAMVNEVIKDTATTGLVTDPGPGSPNRLLYKWNGYLSGSGDVEYEPDGTSWAQGAGYISAWLVGKTGTDPDLYLQRWNGAAWVYVASSTSSGRMEKVVYNGAAGTYRLVVASYSGSGNYDAWVSRP